MKLIAFLIAKEKINLELSLKLWRDKIIIKPSLPF